MNETRNRASQVTFRRVAIGSAIALGLLLLVAIAGYRSTFHASGFVVNRDLATSIGLSPRILPDQALDADRRGLSRSLRLLERSRDRNSAVRILFYGQSITEQGWWRRVESALHRAYPQADLQIENRAIGGHSSSLLLKTARADVLPFQPDLIIFHAYGSHKDYEALIVLMRENTTADILIATDHVTLDAQLDEETRPLLLTMRSWFYRLPFLASPEKRLSNWNAWLNASFLPTLAERHDLGLAEVREMWKRDLRRTHRPASSLLRDGLHLNEEGQMLMASIVERYLMPTSVEPAGTAAASDDVETDVELASVTPGSDGRISIDFVGHRVDVVLNEAPLKPLDVRIDGSAPCSLPDAHGFNRVTSFPGTNWPALLQVRSSSTPLLAEHWKATVFGADPELKRFRFRLEGSRTGPDGEGSSLERFVSRSGRILVEPSDWDLAYARAVTGRQLAPEFEVQWDAVCRGLDALVPETTPSEGPRTLVLGLRNTRHVLSLPNGAHRSVASLRFYRPPEGRH